MRRYPVNMTTMNEVFAEALRRKIVPHPRGAEDTKRQAALLRRVSYACPPECLPALAETVGHLEAGRTTTEVSTGRMLAYAVDCAPGIDALAIRPLEPSQALSIVLTDPGTHRMELRLVPPLARIGLGHVLNEAGDGPDVYGREAYMAGKFPTTWLSALRPLMRVGLWQDQDD